MKKRIFSIFIVFFMCINLNICLASEQEVKYYYFAEKLWNLGLFLGSDGSFNLDKPMTRAESAVMVTRLLGKEEEAINNIKPIPFTDVPAWSKPYVSYLYNNKITYGISDKLYGNDDPVSASQYITFVLRVLGYKDGLDFKWEDAAEFAYETGLIGEACLNNYRTNPAFLRDNAALISYSALYLYNDRQSGLLIDKIVTKTPEGTLPTATAK